MTILSRCQRNSNIHKEQKEDINQWVSKTFFPEELYKAYIENRIQDREYIPLCDLKKPTQ